MGLARTIYQRVFLWFAQSCVFVIWIEEDCFSQSVDKFIISEILDPDESARIPDAREVMQLFEELVDSWESDRANTDLITQAQE